MKRIGSYRAWTLALVVLATLSAVIPVYAQTYSVVYNFGSRSGGPANPIYSGTVAQGRDGNLYTTSNSGGAHRAGAVFEVSPTGHLRVLYSFCSQAGCADGSGPYGGLTLGRDGNFYGTTFAGGNQILGTIFKMAPNGSLTVLHNFTGGNSDGALPEAAPIQGTSGNFYGTTPTGGSGNCGTVYRVTTSGAFTLLAAFDTIHGCGPQGPLALGGDGNFYGTALAGGTNGDGVIFQVSPAGALTVLYNFDGTHGREPYAPLVEGSDGSFYGTAYQGGTADAGVVFNITNSGTLTVLHNLNGTTDGGAPIAGLVQATDGNFYGTAALGGNNSKNCVAGGIRNCGTLFQITPAGSYSVVHDFDGITGFLPLVTPLHHTNGLLYGDTEYGGSGVLCPGDNFRDLCGLFYSLDASLRAFVTLLPYSGKVGSTIEFLGQGFTSASTVSFNGTAATVASCGNSGTFLRARVPPGATTGFVTVTTSKGTLTSNKQFVVTQ